MVHQAFSLQKASALMRMGSHEISSSCSPAIVATFVPHILCRFTCNVTAERGRAWSTLAMEWMHYLLVLSKAFLSLACIKRAPIIKICTYRLQGCTAVIFSAASASTIQGYDLQSSERFGIVTATQRLSHTAWADPLPLWFNPGDSTLQIQQQEHLAVDVPRSDHWTYKSRFWSNIWESTISEGDQHSNLQAQHHPSLWQVAEAHNATHPSSDVWRYGLQLGLWLWLHTNDTDLFINHISY